MHALKTILLTGSKGFIGSNMTARLNQEDGWQVIPFDIENSDADLEHFVYKADFIFHFAGVNRSDSVEAFEAGNSDLTWKIVSILKKNNLRTPVVMTSSIHSELDTPYGISKRKAETHLKHYIKSGGIAYIYRLSNVFGKWCRPNYNSVVATFCHNIANGKKISISNRKTQIEFIYIDDVIDEFIRLLRQKQQDKIKGYYTISPSYTVSLGELADTLYRFKDIRESLCVPDFSNAFVKKLHATYLSYLPWHRLSYRLKKYEDHRGDLFELIKSEQFGQIFVSTTKSGVTRGDHYHHTKNEKFCVIQGDAEIKLRHILNNEIMTYSVSGKMPEVIDIPPGYTHSITNVGVKDVITLFWANEMFSAEKPDTYFEKVIDE
ncbi:MAG: capsular biosynthesis protein [Desulfobacterales bacterium]|nr:MAG: capsular biosynthesis protein [Desulfobacterales bacterium]